MTRGRWYWFRCLACLWRGVRYRNVKKCPRCRAGVKRGGRAKEGA